MEFLLLGGMILVMSLFSKVPAMKEANKALMGLQIPVGIVVLVVGLSLIGGKGSYEQNFIVGLLGVIAGATLIVNLFKLIPKAEKTADKVSSTLATFQVPIGLITIIFALTAMF